MVLIILEDQIICFLEIKVIYINGTVTAQGRGSPNA